MSKLTPGKSVAGAGNQLQSKSALGKSGPALGTNSSLRKDTSCLRKSNKDSSPAGKINSVKQAPGKDSSPAGKINSAKKEPGKDSSPAGKISSLKQESGKSASPSAPPKPPINRTTYEIVDGGNDEAIKTPPVNRDRYEIVDAGPKGGSDIEVDSHLPSLASDFEPPGSVGHRKSRGSKSPDSVSSRSRRSRPKEPPEKPDKKLSFLLTCLVGVLVAVLVFGGVILMAIHFTRTKTTTKPSAKLEASQEIEDEVLEAKHFRETKDCLGPGSLDRDASCIIGSPPTHSPECSDSGKCHKIRYQILQHGSNLETMETVETVAKSTSENIFCLQNPGDRLDRAHVCVDKSCKGLYKGESGLYNIENYRGIWVDSCDQLNKCWIDANVDQSLTQKTFDNDGLIDRKRCRNATLIDCPNDNVTKAIVWLQHLTCVVNPSYSGERCKGDPMRLWKCFDCPLSRTSPEQFATLNVCRDLEYVNLTSSGCVVECRNSSTNETEIEIRYMPNGVGCGSVDENRYCFRGMCMKAKAKDRTIRSEDECQKRMKLREMYWSYSKYDAPKE